VFEPTTITVNDGPVRTIVIGDKVWLVLTDVLKAMSSTTNVTHAAEAVSKTLGDNHVSQYPVIDNIGRSRIAKTITEEALGFLIIRGNRSPELTLLVLEKIQECSAILKALDNFEIPIELPDLFVYAIREKDTGHIKLGISNDPDRRMKELQTGNSHPLELLGYRRAVNRFKDEQEIHKEMSAYHLRGEWFDSGAPITFENEALPC